MTPKVGLRSLIWRGITLSSALAFAVLLSWTAGGALYFELSWAGYIELAALATVALFIAVGAAAALMRDEVRLIARWADGDSTLDSAAAWRATARLPLRASTTAAIIFTPLLLPSVNVYWASVRDFAVHTHLTIAAVNGIAVGLVWALCVFGLELATRPVLREISRTLPASFSPVGPGWSLRTRALIPVVFVALASALLAGALVSVVDQPDERLAAALLGGLGSTAFFGVVLRRGSIDAILRPVDDLAAAARRVAGGNLAEPVPVTSTDELGGLARAFNEMQRGLREREALRAAFGSYVDPALAERVLSQGRSNFDGEKVDVTLLFLDVRDFTGFAERTDAEHIVARLNELFELVIPIITERGGHANKFLGDGLLAVFGAPAPLPDHADRAIDAARVIQTRIAADATDGLTVGMGINSGNVIAGTIGGGGKLEFTILGDAVNVASRVEKLTKDTGDWILVTRATVDAAADCRAALEPRGVHAIRGRREPVEIFAVVPGTVVNEDEARRLRGVP